MNKKGLTQLKKMYQEKFHNLCEKFLENHNSKAYLKKQTQLVDKLLVKIWKSLSISENISLVAVGGYGRKELFPYSDVDILIIFEKEISKNDQESISQFLTNCWDLGFKVGHSVRNIKESKYEFKKDITTATNLIESRFIIGSLSVFSNQAEITSLDVKVKLALPVKLPQEPLKVVSFDVNVPGVAPSDAEQESEFPSSSSPVLAVETQYLPVPPSSPVIEVLNSKSALILNSFLIIITP